MIKQVVLILIMFNLTACLNPSHSVKREQNKGKTIVIDLDKKANIDFSKGSLTLTSDIISIGDNDEVVFKGKILAEKSPIQWSIRRKKGSNQDNDEVKREIYGNKFSIKTSELRAGDEIIIRDKNGNIFVKKRVKE